MTTPGDHDELSDDDTVAYQPPMVVWREPHEPIALTLSCAKVPGQTACSSGPTTF